MSVLCRALSQGMQERGNEIRTFMPRYGLINERRNQLHEVIRLSGMNLIIDNNDHQLIIKVASIPSARVQIYFIDNEDYFHRKAMIGTKTERFLRITTSGRSSLPGACSKRSRSSAGARISCIATVGSRPSFRYTCAMRSPTIRSSSARRAYCRFTTMRRGGTGPGFQKQDSGGGRRQEISEPFGQAHIRKPDEVRY